MKSLAWLFSPLIRVENEGALPVQEEPLIFTFNHNNAWETFPLALFLMDRRDGKIISFVIDWMYGKLPLVGWILNPLSPIYVYNKPARWKVFDRFRKRGGEAVHRECVERLRSKGSIGIFPEGKRNANPTALKRGRKGIGEIALRTGIPVIPIGIDFPCRVHRGRVPRFGRLILRIGQPLVFPEERAIFQKVTEANDCSPLERKRITLFLDARVTHRIMIELGKLSGKTYPFPQPYRAFPLGIPSS
jgi:1-acyl-sn-glycerol-3-phosphate acyltransferase